MADMTKTTMDIFLPEDWSHLISVNYQAATMIANLVDRRWEGELGVGAGDTIRIPTFTGPTSVTKRTTFGTGAALTASAETESSVLLLVNIYAYDHFRVPEEMSVQARPEYIFSRIAAGGAALARQIDTDLAGNDTDGFDGYSTVRGTDGSDLTEDDILGAQADLEANNAPENYRYLVVSPPSYNSLLKIEAFRNTLYMSAMGNLDGSKGYGYAGHILSFDVYKSNLLEANTLGKKNAAFQREATALCVQRGIEMKHNFNIEDGMFDQYAASIVYGFKEVKDNHGVELDGK